MKEFKPFFFVVLLVSFVVGLFFTYKAMTYRPAVPDLTSMPTLIPSPAVPDLTSTPGPVFTSAFDCSACGSRVATREVVREVTREVVREVTREVVREVTRVVRVVVTATPGPTFTPTPIATPMVTPTPTSVPPGLVCVSFHWSSGVASVYLDAVPVRSGDTVCFSADVHYHEVAVNR